MRRQLERCLAYAARARPVRAADRRLPGRLAQARRHEPAARDLAPDALPRWRACSTPARPPTSTRALTKLHLSECARRSRASTPLQIHGGYGYMTEYGLERDVRDALGGRIYRGTSEMQRNVDRAPPRPVSAGRSTGCCSPPRERARRARRGGRRRARSCTYAELDRASSALAHALVDHGVAPGDRVGLLLEKSLEALVGDLRHPQGRRDLRAARRSGAGRAAGLHRSRRRHSVPDQRPSTARALAGAARRRRAAADPDRRRVKATADAGGARRDRVVGARRLAGHAPARAPTSPTRSPTSSTRRARRASRRA